MLAQRTASHTPFKRLDLRWPGHRVVHTRQAYRKRIAHCTLPIRHTLRVRTRRDRYESHRFIKQHTYAGAPVPSASAADEKDQCLPVSTPDPSRTTSPPDTSGSGPPAASRERSSARGESQRAWPSTRESARGRAARSGRVARSACGTVNILILSSRWGLDA